MLYLLIYSTLSFRTSKLPQSFKSSKLLKIDYSFKFQILKSRTKISVFTKCTQESKNQLIRKNYRYSVSWLIPCVILLIPILSHNHLLSFTIYEQIPHLLKLFYLSHYILCSPPICQNFGTVSYFIQKLANLSPKKLKRSDFVVTQKLNVR